MAKENRGRPAVSKSERRVNFSCRVHPDTIKTIDKILNDDEFPGCSSLGKTIDSMVKFYNNKKYKKNDSQ